jgi:hypothetical protein
MKMKKNLMESDRDMAIADALLTLSELAHWPAEKTIYNVEWLIEMHYADAREDADHEERREKKKIINMAKHLFPVVVDALKL